MGNLVPSHQEKKRDSDRTQDIHQWRANRRCRDRAQIRAEQALGSFAETGNLPGFHTERFYDAIAGDGFMEDVLHVGELILSFSSSGTDTTPNTDRREDDDRDEEEKNPSELLAENDH